jgi:hypothetical protein
MINSKLWLQKFFFLIYGLFTDTVSSLEYIEALIQEFGFRSSFFFNTLRAGRVVWRFLLLNVADRSHDMTILGHVMLQRTTPCSGDTQTHNFCVVCLPNVLLSSQKRDPSVFLSHYKGKYLCHVQIMPLFVSKLYVPGNNGSRTKAVKTKRSLVGRVVTVSQIVAVTGDNKELWPHSKSDST